jgi:hypothetical protein
MKKLAFAACTLCLSLSVSAKIEDNSFLLEEAFNQEAGVYQFIQKYQTFDRAKGYEYSFENEIPVPDERHQFSYEFSRSRATAGEDSEISDTTLNYRWQPLNKDGLLVAQRFGLIVPTGKPSKGSGNGVYGFEFMQAATIPLNERFMNHWNLGFSVLPNAKSAGHDEKGTISGFSAGSSIIYLWKDNFNFLLEGLLESGQEIDATGEKLSSTSFTLNPGMRFAIDLDWKDTQIVPGISFPTEMMNGPTEHGVLVYLSIEPKFY